MTPAAILALASGLSFYLAILHSAGTAPDALSLSLGGLSVALALLGICWKGREA